MDAINTQVYPAGILTTLSKNEVARLTGATTGELSERLRRCVLAVLNSGNPNDDADEVLAQFEDFGLEIVQINRGIRLDLKNAPTNAFVDGNIIQGIRELMSAVVRDLIYYHTEIRENNKIDLTSPADITNAVFEIARNAQTLKPQVDPDMVVCWGGHSINENEYEYSKDVGYQLGLRKLNICTGCGAGAMKGPMKGATIAHAKQRINPGRYLGISEPGIIAVESPNPIVNQLLIMPDIEKRLEAFVRLGHGIIVFPGGAGTTEEILFLLGVLLHPDNEQQPYPVVFTGPAESKEYFEKIDKFLVFCLGEQVREKYQIIVDDPVRVAQLMHAGVQQVREYRKQTKDAYYFNWSLHIDPDLQQRFKPTHVNMAALNLSKQQPVHHLIRDLRCAFSGIVAGNIKPDGVRAIREHGLFDINGDADLLAAVDDLLQEFTAQHRMKLPGNHYEPCYRMAR